METSAASVPPWLKTMRDISGTKEVQGGGDSPVIFGWRDEIARRFPDYDAYCKTYTHDEIPWCGLTVAYVMAHNGIKPVKEFLWAANWAKFGIPLKTPRLGCIMVFSRSGGNHVTLYEGEDSSNYLCRGGNQSDSVNLTKIPKDRHIVGMAWPGETVSATGITLPPPPAPIKKPTPSKVHEGIVCTVFSGPDDALDNSVSAYGGPVDHWKPGVALPARFVGVRPKVKVTNPRTGKSVVCDIVDVGPWNTKDPYWEVVGGRPQAESGVDMRGRPTNMAGIDLTPAAALAIGVVGKGMVDWEFVDSKALEGGVAGTIVAGGAAAAPTKAGSEQQSHPGLILAILFGAIILALGAWFGIRWWKAKHRPAVVVDPPPPPPPSPSASTPSLGM